MLHVLFAAALLAAPVRAQAPSRSTDTFVALAGRAWLTLDPADAFDAVSNIAVGNVYETLVAFKSVDDVDALRPFLSEKVPTRANRLISADGLTYEFPIRAGVRFHDGSELTPEDVRYSLLRFMLLDPDGGPAGLLLRPVLGVDSTRGPDGKPALSFDDALRSVEVKGNSVVIHLKQPDAAFLKRLASLPVVLSKKWAMGLGAWDGTAAGLAKLNGRKPEDSPLRDAADGTGPFRVESADRRQGELVLRRHEGYWRKPAALREARLRAVQGDEMRLLMLQAGDADAAYIEPASRAEAAATPGLQVVADPPGDDVGDIVFFNLRDPAFSDAHARRGAALALDYDDYLKTALGGKGVRLGAAFPRRFLAQSPAPLRRDPAKAAEELKKAAGGKLWEQGFSASIAFSADNARRRELARILKRDLEALNPKFRLTLLPLPSEEFYSSLEAGKLSLFIGGYYADYPDPQSFAYGLIHSKSYFPKYQGYRDEKADALIDRARAAAASERAALYAQAAALAAQDLPHLPTFAPEPFSVCRREVVGCRAKDNVNNLAFNGFPYFYSYSKK